MVDWPGLKTWVIGILVKKSDLDTYVNNALQYLFSDRPYAKYNLNEASDYTTTSGSFADVDSTDLALTLTVSSGKVKVCFDAYIVLSSSGRVYLDVAVDGTRIGGDDGICVHSGNSGRVVIPGYIIDGLSVGSHTFKLQWKQGNGITLTMYAGAGTSNFDVHPQFNVVEF